MNEPIETTMDIGTLECEIELCKSPKSLTRDEEMMLIVEAVCEEIGVLNPSHVFLKTREKGVVLARQVSMYLIKDRFRNFKPKFIGDWFGRDRTTVIHSLITIEGYLTYDKQLAKNISNIQRNLAKLRY